MEDWSKKIKILTILLLFIFGRSYAQKEDDLVFIPDTTIGNVLKLRNSASVVGFFDGNIKYQESFDIEEPFVCFLNSDTSEYMIVYHFYGDLQNQFSLFEVAEIEREHKTYTCNYTKYDRFSTESGIALGMGTEQLILIKGKPHSKLETDKVSVYKYRISKKDTTFLKRYKMPIYFAEYYFYENSLIRYQFGFEYP